MVEDSIRATRPSELDGPDWLLASMSALFWPMVAPFYVVYKITRAIASVTGIARWIDSKPLPRVDRKLAKIERKSEERQAKLDKLNDNIRAAERELASVNADIRRIQTDHGYGTHLPYPQTEGPLG